MESITVPVNPDRISATLWPSLTTAEILHLSDRYVAQYREYCEFCQGQPILPQRLWCCIYSRFRLLKEEHLNVLASYLELDTTTVKIAEQNGFSEGQVKSHMQDILLIFNVKKMQTVTNLLSWARLLSPQLESDISLEIERSGKSDSNSTSRDGASINYRAFFQEQTARGKTTLDLWREYYREGKLAISYSSFVKKYRIWKQTSDVAWHRQPVGA